MGKIELDHTGSGSGITLSSDGTSLLLGGSAVGGGADLYAANEVSVTAQPSATGDDAIAIGDSAVSSGANSIAIGKSLASGNTSLAVNINYNTSSYGALGGGSVAIGDRAKSTGASAIAIGQRATASANYAMALGAGNGTVEASVAEAIAIGTGAYSNLTGKLAFSSGPFGTSLGHAQTGIRVLKCSTTDATPKVLVAGAGSGTNLNQVSLPNNSAFSFHGTIVARQQASQGTASAAWKVEGLIRREGSAGTTVLVNSATTVLDNTPSWGIALSADTTTGSLKIEGTGAASTNIRWVGTIHTSEVTYA